MFVLKLEPKEKDLLERILKNVCRPDLERITKDTLDKDSLDKLLWAFSDAVNMDVLAKKCGLDDDYF